MDKRELEESARRLLADIWAQKHLLWPDRDPKTVHPLEACDPDVAARMLGFDLEYQPRIHFTTGIDHYETAGVLMRKQQKVVVATRWGPQTSRFTAAHELAHWVRHKGMHMHRDPPIKGVERQVRSPVEQEADYFAACFLMPAKVVTNCFHDMFLTRGNPFVFDEAAVFHLARNDERQLLFSEEDSLERELALATTHRFGTQRTFEKSLSEIFNVSRTSMAIRIRELELIRPWP